MTYIVMLANTMMTIAAAAKATLMIISIRITVFHMTSVVIVVVIVHDKQGNNEIVLQEMNAIEHLSLIHWCHMFHVYTVIQA